MLVIFSDSGRDSAIRTRIKGRLRQGLMAGFLDMALYTYNMDKHLLLIFMLLFQYVHKCIS